METKCKRLKDRNGITLIALIITIIVMLILAGVVLSITITDNGIITNAKEAGEEYRKQELKEELELKIVDIQIEKGKQEFSMKNIIVELPNKVDKGTLIWNDTQAEEPIGIYKEYEFYITKQYEVIIGKKNPSESNEELQDEYVFYYTGNYEEFEVPVTGYYKIECWGASGGYSLSDGAKGAAGGKGAYAKGQIYLKQGEKIYIYVGQKGTDALNGKDTEQSYNGRRIRNLG